MIDKEYIVCCGTSNTGFLQVYLVFEKMMGGRLVEVVQKRPSEDKTIRIFRQLIEGIQYLHSK